MIDMGSFRIYETLEELRAAHDLSMRDTDEGRAEAEHFNRYMNTIPMHPRRIFERLLK